ncbi:hypothetical protein PsYK624_147050 [Phanerochaete sordida]|uniref:Uncharacterized protein n=1 Tax=Phanerochaete sordida TaxID=48140 RepID=A0A9P3LKE3_9APHY|nr:hypothetical protein PsYK624_147050 [Phanerochaete sordida]
MPWIPRLVVGRVDIIMRADGRFGVEDPLNWPQLFSPSRPYLAFLPRQPRPHVEIACLWETPKPQEFVHANDDPSGLAFGYLDSGRVSAAQKAVTSLDNLVAEFRGLVPPPPAPVTAELCRLQAATHNALTIFAIPSSYRAIIALWARLHRSWAECWAYMRWHLATQRSTVSTLFANDSRIPLHHGLDGSGVIGAICSDYIAAQKLYAAGVPVWLVQPRHAAGDLQTQGGPPVQFTQPTSVEQGQGIVMGDVRAKETAGEEHLAAITRESEAALDVERVVLPIGFGMDDTVENESATSDFLQNTTGKLRLFKIFRLSLTSLGQAIRLSSPIHSLLPTRQAVWREALEGLDPSQPCKARVGLWLPEPEFLVMPESKLRLLVYISNWVSIRMAVFHKLGRPSLYGPISPSAWRTVLSRFPPQTEAEKAASEKRRAEPRPAASRGRKGGSHSGKAAKGKSGHVDQAQKRHQEKEAVCKYFTALLGFDHAPLALQAEPLAKLAWRGSSFTISQADARAGELPMDSDLIREIAWELSEVAFRVELCELDRRVMPQHAVSAFEDRNKLLAQVFPGKHWSRPDLPPPPATLTANDIRARSGTKEKKNDKLYEDGTIREAAALIQSLVEERVHVKMEDDELTEDYHERIWTRARDDKCVWLRASPGETKERYVERYLRLAWRIRKWVGNNHAKQAVMSLPSFTTSQPKPSSIRAMDIFSRSDHETRPRTKRELELVDPDKAREWQLKEWNSDVRKAWNALTDEERGHFDRLAAAEKLLEDGPGVVEAERLRATAMAAMAEHVPRVQEHWNSAAGCISVVFVGGIDGVMYEPRVWVQNFGFSKTGETFIQRLAARAGWPEEMIQIIWYEWVVETLYNGEGPPGQPMPGTNLPPPQTEPCPSPHSLSSRDDLAQSSSSLDLLPSRDEQRSSFDLPPSSVDLPPTSVDLPPPRDQQPSRDAEPSPVDLPPSRDQQPSSVGLPPSRDQQPSRDAEPSPVDLPPSREQQPSSVDLPPSRDQQPSRNAEPSPVDLPPSREQQPSSVDLPPSRDQQPSRDAEPWFFTLPPSHDEEPSSLDLPHSADNPDQAPSRRGLVERGQEAGSGGAETVGPERGLRMLSPPESAHEHMDIDDGGEQAQELEQAKPVKLRGKRRASPATQDRQAKKATPSSRRPAPSTKAPLSKSTNPKPAAPLVEQAAVEFPQLTA